MPAPAERRPDIDATSPPSERSDVDDTAAGASAAGGATGFGPPAERGEVGTLGPYRVVKEFGKGGMGAVYAALDTRLDRRLALKVMLPQFAADPAARERFLREAKAAAKVKHDNVVTVYEADERDGVPYIAMEYLEGYPLDEFLKKQGNPTPAQVLRLAAEAAAGLAAAHRLGLVHRDIKPGNLWLEAPAGRVKVLDFGLAKPVEAEVELTKSGAIVGTPAYMSPEQARGERVDHRTDLFSLGALLYRLCTGRLPFPGQTTMAVLMALGMDEPPPVRDVNPAVPEELAALVHQLLAKSPAARPQSADEVVRRVRAIGQSLTAARARALEQSTSQPQVIPSQVSAAPMVVTAHDANPFADLDAPESESLTEAIPEAAPVGRKPGGKLLAAAAGLAALVLMVFGGVIIIIRNRDGTETKIEVPDGATVEVKDKKTGKTLATVGPKAGPTTKDDSPDRKAAEYVLSVGGRVGGTIGEKGFDVAAAPDLPRERFTLTAVILEGKAAPAVTPAAFAGCAGLLHVSLKDTPVTDAELAHLKDCTKLRTLELSGTKVTGTGLADLKACSALGQINFTGAPVTDAGLTHLAARTALTVLNLNNTKVTDAGLSRLTGCTALQELHLNGTGVTDAGLKLVATHAGLTGLHLDRVAVTDAGLAELKALTKLRELDLGNTPVTGAGLAHLRGCQELHRVVLWGSKVTDAGMAHLRECRRLSSLLLSDTALTDAGLAHLHGCKSLTFLDVRITMVTVQGLAALHAAVPGCKITHDGGTIEPIDSDRPAAEWVFAAGGAASVTGVDGYVRAAPELPKGRFEVFGINLDGKAVAGLDRVKHLRALTRLHLNDTPTADADLANVSALVRLEDLQLTGTKVTDAGLVHLRDLRRLNSLYLGSTAVTGSGIAHLAGLTELKLLALYGSPVTDAGLAHLTGLKQLDNLNLCGTKVTDAGMGHIGKLTGLTVLGLHSARLTDAGLAPLKGLGRLAELDVRKTGVTPTGLADFHATVPGCRVLHDGGTIEAANLDRAAAEYVLSVGGSVGVNDGDVRSPIAAAADLPRGAFVLIHAELGGKAVTDAGLAPFRGCTSLSRVVLSDTKVTDAGLAHFAGCRKLNNLTLVRTATTDAGLAHFKDCRELAYLALAGTKVTDAGLAHLKDCPTFLQVDLSGTAVTDAGLAHLGASRGLTRLDVRGTPVTAAGVARFRAAVPGCRVDHD